MNNLIANIFILIQIKLLNLRLHLKFKAMSRKKNFVLDTNVILHDYRCIFNFEEHDIYIPMVVLEELDHFKKGNEQINFNAREFSRELDMLANEALFKKGDEICKI